QRALALLREIWEVKLEPDQWSATAQASAHARKASSGSELWRCSERCGRRSWSPASSYSAGISACEKGEQWQRALALFSEVWEAKLELDLIQLQCRDQRVRERRTVAGGPVLAQHGVGGKAGAQCHLYLHLWNLRVRERRAVAAGSGADQRDLIGADHQLQCRDHRVRERRTVAAGPVLAQHGVGGKAGAQCHLYALWATTRRVSTNSTLCRCSARWRLRSGSQTLSAIALGSSRARRASSGGRLCRCSARWCRRSWSAASSATALGSARARKPTVSTVLASVGSASSLGRALSAYDGPGLLPYASSPLISDVFERPRACVQRRDQRVREGRAVAAIRVDVQRDGAGDVGARCQPLPHRDQRVREREAVSAAPVPARRDVAGEGGLSRPELQRQYQHTR
ncbi:unnamed protein product, partial [Prorocentrum cordatum]